MDDAKTEPARITIKNKKRLISGLIGIAVAVLAAGLAYVYWYQNPSKVLSDALLHAASAESVVYKGTATRVGPVKMVATLDGGAGPEGASLNAEVDFDSAGKKYTLEGNSILDEKSDLYVKVRNIDSLAANYRRAISPDSQKLFDQLVMTIDDKWVKVSSNDIRGFSSNIAKLQKCSADAAEKIESDQAVKSEIVDLYKKHSFIAVNKHLGAKGGSLGYELTVNPAVSRAFIKEYKTTALYQSLVACDDSFAVDDNDLTKRAGSANVPRIELWVHRWTHHITKVSIADETNDQASNIAIEPTFNRPVAIVAPKEVTTLEQLQQDIRTLLSTSQSTQTPTP